MGAFVSRRPPTVPLLNQISSVSTANELEHILFMGAQGLLTPEDFARILRAHGGGGSSRPPGAPVPKIYRYTSTIKNDVNLRKQSMSLIPVGPPHSRQFGISFTFDTRIPVVVSVFFVAEEPKTIRPPSTRPPPPVSTSSDAGAVPTATTTSSSSSPPTPYEPIYKARFTPVVFDRPGLGLVYRSAPTESFEASQYTDTELFSHYTDPIGPLGPTASPTPESPSPTVVQFSPDATPCSTFPILVHIRARDTHPSDHISSQTTYAVFGRGDSGDQFSVRVVKQKIQVGGINYELKDIYGVDRAAESTSAAADPSQQQSGDCVVCLSAPRDTTILPCRHMCLCHDCAGELAQRSDKCPICRAFISDFVELQLSSEKPGPTTALLPLPPPPPPLPPGIPTSTATQVQAPFPPPPPSDPFTTAL